jgi:hypothetical protein
MNILLQDRRTLKYIDPMAGWTDKRNEARSFRQGLDALFFCYNTGLPNMAMLFDFADSRNNFSFPVTDHRGD